MPRIRVASCVLILIGLILGPRLGCAEPDAPVAQSVGLAIVDFAYLDTSGEPTDQTAVHQRRLQDFMTALRRDLAEHGQFHLVPVSCGRVSCTLDGPPPPDLLLAARDAGAKFLVIGGIHKMSTLVQWAKVAAIDIAADRVIAERRITFRGDSDEAWDRAELFVSREIRTALAAR